VDTENRGLTQNKQLFCKDDEGHDVFEYEESGNGLMTYICRKCGEVIFEPEDSTP